MASRTSPFDDIAPLPVLDAAGARPPSSGSLMDEKRSVSSASQDELEGKEEVHAHAEQASPFEGGEYNPAVVGHPARIKYVATFAVLFFSLGSNFLSSSISPLKSTLRKELGINNAQYASVDTASSLINTILPIVSGIAIDYYGPFAGAIWSSFFIFLGAILTSVAASRGSYPLFLAAQIIFGIGDTSIETTQNKLYSFYALGGGIVGFIYGLDIGIGRVWNLSGRLSAVPIYEGTGHFAWTFWIGTILCGFTFALVLALWAYSFTFPEPSQVPTGRKAARARAAEAARRGEVVKTDFISLWKTERKYFMQSLFAIPACFWIFDVSALLQNGAVSAYTSNLADAISVTRDKSKAAAGYTSAIGQIIPIVLTPALGFLFDRWGHRMAWVTWTASLWIVVFCLLAYTQVNALCVSILGSLALATNVLPYIASIPLLVPDQRRLGTAFGVYKALNNCNSVITNVAAGAIQDKSGTGKNQYSRVFAFLIAIKAIDVLLGLSYQFLDKKYLHGVLTASDAKLRRLEAEIPQEELHGGVRAPRRGVSIFGLSVVSAAIVVAWVLYWVYSV
ncbi:hypothetical protein JCM10213_007612 [Rhodosporidiobolus nylandii]